MATPRLDACILAASQRLSDTRVDASSAGDSGARYKSAVLVRYANDSINDLVMDRFVDFGDQFAQIMPEMTKTSSALALSSGAVDFPSDAWLFLDLASSTLEFRKITDNISRVKIGKDPFIQPTDKRPYFYEEARTIKTLGVITGNVTGRYIISPTVLTQGGSLDIPLAPIWDSDIIKRMVAYGFADANVSISG